MAVVIAVAASALEARAATPGATPPPKPIVPFEIKSIDRATRAQVYVENAWKQNVPGISVSVRTTKEGGSSNAFINAWFYNKDKEPVAKFDKPAQSAQAGATLAAKPDFWKQNETYTVFFPLTERTQSGKERWRRVIVVFGEGSQAVAQIYPQDEISGYDYPAKEVAVVKGKQPATPAPKP
jgi:hypothetical protein